MVDAGGRGDFVTIQDAVDYYAARGSGTTGPTGHGHIYIREGYYKEHVEITSRRLMIEGASWDTIIDGTDSGDAAVTLASGSTLTCIKNLQVKTTQGGSDGGGIYNESGAGNNVIDTVYFSESNANGSNFASGNCLITGCVYRSADGSYACTQNAAETRVVACDIQAGVGATYAGPNGDDMLVVACELNGSAASSVTLSVTSENCVIVGNRCMTAITDPSGTSTVTGNNTN